MKNISVLFIVLGLLSIVTSCVASSQGPVYQERYANRKQDIFHERIENQQRRINQGIESGELTRKEARILQDNLNWIRNQYARMTANGILTQNEQERLDKMLDKNSEMIKNKKHNPARQLYDTDVQDRIDSQQRRIHQGLSSGKLTRHEADIVQDNLSEIRRRYAKMRKDGVLTMKELEKLDKMLDENSNMISRKEFNRDYNIKRIY
jgi:predicted PilT family ATPase